jgi:hypothetical protein
MDDSSSEAGRLKARRLSSKALDQCVWRNAASMERASLAVLGRHGVTNRHQVSEADSIQ